MDIRVDRYFRSARADRTILNLGLIYEYVQPTVGGCAVCNNHFPQVSPGAMQGLIRHGGSGGDTISVKKVIHNFHQQPLKFNYVSRGPLTADCQRLS